MNKITYLAGTAALSAMMAMLCGSEAHAQAKLQKQGTATQITVGGKPMLLLCGELSNSAATCEADIISVMRTCKERGLNTVLVPAQWDLIEPEEGKFDFSLPKTVIEQARKKRPESNISVVWSMEKLHELLCTAMVQGKHQEISARNDTPRKAS